MDIPAIIKQNQRIILFDGVCNLCSAFLEFVFKRDKKNQFKFAWIQSKIGKGILYFNNLPTEYYDTIVYIENGQPYYKSTAFLKIMKQLKFPWPLLQIGIILPRFLRNWMYDLVARFRHKLFGRKEQCMLPGGELSSRFL